MPALPSGLFSKSARLNVIAGVAAASSRRQVQVQSKLKPMIAEGSRHYLGAKS
jgi:hypothetical protein